ncbi:hypothetical protein GWK47_006798 [Chionoecetes opilio]|uniref:Uncharacterized protein n=1 Tax=Chionoecetes opilio TaxID=41210 RepID=A0A8J5CU04_CHIOP|nr:hypothetical protein GWK47_006798 [Chionoecetes opilio]
MLREVCQDSHPANPSSSDGEPCGRRPIPPLRLAWTSVLGDSGQRGATFFGLPVSTRWPPPRDSPSGVPHGKDWKIRGLWRWVLQVDHGTHAPGLHPHLAGMAPPRVGASLRLAALFSKKAPPKGAPSRLDEVSPLPPCSGCPPVSQGDEILPPLTGHR